MNEDTIRDIYYVEHKWNPHFFYLSPKSFCQDLETMGQLSSISLLLHLLSSPLLPGVSISAVN